MATPVAQVADAAVSTQPALKVYWQPGCSSCLGVKEFLTQRNVPFVSVNVLADMAGFSELAELGLRRVPIVCRGG
ncbi:MAG: glutaredoxin domain-containing protein, partial [Casimicrobiaceae bacterium]